MVPPPLLRRVQLVFVLLILDVAALAWLAVRPSEIEGAQREWRTARRIPFTDVSPYGARFFLDEEPDDWNRAKTVEMASAAGIRWAKQHFQWYAIEPRKGHFDWAKYDQIVNLYRAQGIEVIARLDFPPAWVAPAEWVPPEFHGVTENFPPASMADYASFVAETVRHFKGRVRFFQIWNEPNLIKEWGFSLAHPVAPKEYVNMLKSAAQAAKKYNPDAVILSAPLAINTEHLEQGGNLNDLDYLRGMYQAGAADYFDVLAANAFGKDDPPEAPPDAARLNFRRMELQRQVMELAGDGQTPVWMTEYGWNASPADFPPARLAWGRVSAADQAAFTVRGVDWAAAHWPWAGVFNVWYFRQSGRWLADDPIYYFAMVDVDFTPRRIYAAVQEAARSQEVAGPGEWAERSAPVVPHERAADKCFEAACVDWRWERSKDADVADGNILVSDRAGASLTFRFRGSGVAVRAATGPDAGAFTAKLDDRSLRPGSGAASFTLAGSRSGWQWIDLAGNLGSGIHALELAVGPVGGRIQLDGFRVGSPAQGGGAGSRGQTVLAALAVVFGIVLAIDLVRIGARVHVGS